MQQQIETCKTACLQFLQEEAEEASPLLEPLPAWIHDLFASAHNDSLSDAIKHLETGSSESFATQLARYEEAHYILEGRAQVFSAQFEELRSTALRLHSRLAPFESISTQQQKMIDSLETNQLPFPFPRSQLRALCTEWKAIEKERQETVSGSVLLIGRLWDLLQVPNEERFPLDIGDISLVALKRLEGERKRLIDFQQARFRELYDSHLAELGKLMDALKWSAERRRQLLDAHDAYTAEGLQFISRQIASLQPRLTLTAELLEAINARTALIQKMRDFERSASDPARLFRSSFQLLQEEKFRKTALPSLLASEQKLHAKLSQYRESFAEEFFLDDERPYSQLLEEEIAARYLNEGIFGFDRNREVRIKDAKDAKDAKDVKETKDSNTPRYTTGKKLSTIGSSTTLPQRRPSSKLQ